MMFAKTLIVETAVPLPDPAGVFAGLPAVNGWHPEGSAVTSWRVRPGRRRAGRRTRVLVAAGADVLWIGQSRHSLKTSTSS